MAIELVGFSDLSVFLGLSGNKVEADYPQLTLIQESVVGMFEAFTHRVFEQDAYEENISILSPTKMLFLPAVPIQEVTELVINSVPVTNYKIREYGILLDYKVADSDVLVKYSGGIEEVPEPLKRAALLQTVYEFQNKDSIGIQFVSTDGGSTTKPELGMLKEVKKLLKPFHHPSPIF